MADENNAMSNSGTGGSNIGGDNTPYYVETITQQGDEVVQLSLRLPPNVTWPQFRAQFKDGSNILLQPHEQQAQSHTAGAGTGRS